MIGQCITISFFKLTNTDISIALKNPLSVCLYNLCNFHKIPEYTGVKMEWAAVARLCVSSNDYQTCKI